MGCKSAALNTYVNRSVRKEDYAYIHPISLDCFCPMGLAVLLSTLGHVTHAYCASIVSAIREVLISTCKYKHALPSLSIPSAILLHAIAPRI